MQLQKNALLIVIGATMILTASVPATGLDISTGPHGANAVIVHDQPWQLDGRGTRVGMIDLGFIQADHEWFADGQGGYRVENLDFYGLTAGQMPGPYNSALVSSHATLVASVVGSSNETYTGVAPASELVLGRVSSMADQFTNNLIAAMDYFSRHGIGIVNLSVGLVSELNDGSTQYSMFFDWLAAERDVLIVQASGNEGNSTAKRIRLAGDAYNVLTVGGTQLHNGNYDKMWQKSSYRLRNETGMTPDDRGKPDLVAPATSITGAKPWHPEYHSTSSGTSFAAPHVAGAAALLEQLAARRQMQPVNHNVLKAVLLNSARKNVIDARKESFESTTRWSASDWQMRDGVLTAYRPLDDEQGTGALDVAGAVQLLAAGRQRPDEVRSAAGWDLNEIAAGEQIVYPLPEPLLEGSQLAVTLCWDRIIREDDGDGVVEPNDFYSLDYMADLNLAVRLDGELLGQSISTTDNVEHLWLTIPSRATVEIVVSRPETAGPVQQFALAWSGLAVQMPEPTSLSLLLAATMVLLRRNRKRSLA